MNKDFDINAELNRTTVEGLKDINKEYNKRKKSDNTYFQTEVEAKSWNTSEANKRKKQLYDEARRSIAQDMLQSADPYDNTPSAQKASKKDVLSLSTASYGNSLLEKIAANSNHLEYQNAVLKFQEKQVELLSTIANTVVSMGKVIVSSEAVKQAADAPEYNRNISSMAKALGGADWGAASHEGLASLWKKVDKNGYFNMAKSVFELFKDMMEDGKIKQMVKDKVKDTVLDALPFGLGDAMRKWEKDPVMFMQSNLNRMSVSANRLDRVMAKDFAAFNSISFKNQKAKTDWNAKAIYSAKTDKTINEIIPEYLAEILAAIRKDEAKLYDFEKEQYVGRTELALREHKANESKSWKSAFSEGKRDLLELFGDIRDTHGAHNKNVKSAFDALFNGTNTSGRPKLADDKQFDAFLKRLLEVYGTDAFDMLQIQVDPSTMLRRMYGGDNAAIVENKKILQAMNNLLMTAAKNKTREFDLTDIMYQVQDWNEDNIEGRNAFTTRHSGAGSLSPGGAKFGSRINKFADKYEDIGAGANAALAALRRTSMGERNALDNALNANNVFMNANTVYINAANLIGGRGSRKGSFKPFKFPSFGASINSANDLWNEAMKSTKSNIDINNMSIADREAYYRGRTVASAALNGDMGSVKDYEENAANTYRNYRRFDTNNELSDAYVELNAASSKDQIDKTLKARAVIDNNRIKWDAALALWTTFDSCGITREAYEKAHGDNSGTDRISNPGQLLPFIDEKGNVDWNRLGNADFNLGGLGSEEVYNAKRRELAEEQSSGVKGSGPEAARNIFKLVWNDKRLEGKAGLATGGLLGFAVGNILKDKGIFKGKNSPMWLGATLAGLSYLPPVKKHLDMMLGPDSEVKDAKGYSNAQKAMAKIMSKVVPTVGGIAAGSFWYKTMSQIGPVGQVFGLMGFPIVGAAGYLATRAMGGKLGDWLFGKKDKDAGKFSKFGKFLGGLLPNSIRKLVGKGTNDDNPYIQYANTLREYQPAFMQKMRDRGILENGSEWNRLLKKYDHIVKQISELDPDAENSTEVDMTFKTLMTQAQDMISGVDPEFTKAIDREYASRLQELNLKANDASDLKNAEYAKGDEELLAKRRDEAIQAGTMTGETSLDDYRESLYEELLKNLDEDGTNERKERFMESYKDYFDKDNDISPDDFEHIINLANQYESTDASDVGAKNAKMKVLFDALTQLDPSVIAMIRNMNNRPGADTQAHIRDLVREKWGASTDDEIDRIIRNNKDLAKAYSMKNPNAKNLGFFARFTKSGREKLQGQLDALNYSNSIEDLLRYLTPENIQKLRSEGFTGYNAYVQSDEHQDVGDDTVARYSKFIEDVNSGSGLAKSGVNIPSNLLHIRASDSKSKWSMNDFSRVTIGGRSGNAVGCSIATMNNILHYLGLDEISPNSLAVEANLHTTSSGVKYTFFKAVCNKLGLNYAVFTSKKNVFNKKFFEKNGNKCAYAVLLNNYNGSGHFVFCADLKNGKIKMIDPEGKGYAEYVSVNDIALRASVVIYISKGDENYSYGNVGSFGRASDSPNKWNSNSFKDIEEDDGVFTGLGRKTRMNLSNLSSKAKSFFGKGFSADTSAILEKLTNLGTIIASGALLGSNSKQQSKKFQSIIYRIDKDTISNSSALTSLINSPELVKSQAESNKEESDTARIADATEAIAGAKPGDKNAKNVFIKNIKDKGSSILNMGKNLLGNIPALLKTGLGALLIGGGLAVGKRGWDRFKKNGIENLTEADRDQTIDPSTGKVVDNGHFKDVSKAMNSIKEGARYGRVSWKMIKSGANIMRNSKFVGGIIKKLLSLPSLLVTKLLNSKLGKWLAEKGLTSGLEGFKVAFNKFMQKHAPKIAKKLSEKGSKKAAGEILKRLPGIGLIWYLGQAFVAAYQGYKHAGKLLKIDENEVPTSLRVKTMFAKMLYDVGPELLVSLLKVTPGGAAGFALDVAVIILKEIFTWDRVVEMLGIGNDVRQEIAEKHKADKENTKSEHDIDKEEKGEKYSDDKKLKEEAQENARSREKGISDTPSNNTSANVASTNTSSMLGGAMGLAMSSLTGGIPSSYGGGGSGGGGAFSSFTDSSSLSIGGTSTAIMPGTGEKVTFDGNVEFKKNDMKGNWNKLKDMFAAVSKSTGIPLELLTSIAAQESGFYPLAQAGTSSAKGLFQIINSTWKSLAARLRSQYGIENPNVFNPLHNTLAIAMYMKDNANIIKNAVAAAGLPLDGAALYAANFFGAGGANKFFKALKDNPNVPMTSVFDANVINANSWLRNHTTGTLYQWLQKKMAGGNAKQYVEEAKRMSGSTGSISADIQTAAKMATNPVGTMLNQVVNAANIKNDNINKTPKGVTESDGAYVSPSSNTSTLSSTNHFDDTPTSSNVTDNPTNFPVGSTSNASVTTNNVIVPETNGFAAIIEALSKQGGMQAASIISGLTSLEALLGQILKAINNNKDEAMRLAASGAR